MLNQSAKGPDAKRRTRGGGVDLTLTAQTEKRLPR